MVLTFLFTTQNLRGNRKKRWETRAITSVHINLALVFVFTCRVIFWSIQLCRVALAYATVYCAKRKGRPFQWQTITETIYSFIHIHKWTAYIIYEFIVLALKMADDRWRRRVFFFFSVNNINAKSMISMRELVCHVTMNAKTIKIIAPLLNRDFKRKAWWWEQQQTPSSIVASAAAS